jgi:ELWxxDGT repeat protein
MPHASRRRAQSVRSGRMSEPLEPRRLLSGLAGESFYNPADLVNANNSLIFLNDDQTHGLELWKSDGSGNGTQLLKDINPGPADAFFGPSRSNANVPDLVTIAGITYFTADDGVHGKELWKTGGTAATTSMVTDLVPGAEGSQPGELKVLGNSLIFFTNPLSGDTVLWKTDGTAKGTVALTETLDGSSGLAVVGDTIYFIKDSSDAQRPPELWKSNGQPGGAHRILPTSSIEWGYTTICAHGDELYISYGNSLYRLNSKTDALVSVYDFPQYIRFSPVGAIGNRLLFSGQLTESGESRTPLELWATDGTTAGTTRLWRGSMVSGWPYDISPFQFTPVGGNSVYFSVPADYLGAPWPGTGTAELWRTDGNVAGTRLLQRGGFQTSGVLSNFTDFGGTLYFVDAAKLWKSDGTAAGTNPVIDLPYDGTAYGYSVAARDMAAVNGRLFFAGVDPIHESSAALWTYAPGGKMVKLQTVPHRMSVAGKVLNIRAGYGDDTIRINANAPTGEITVYWNDSPSQTFKMSDVTGIAVSAGSGNDNILLTGPVPRATIYGEDGDDTLTGGDGGDYLDGGNDDDVLRGGAGADALVGGPGNDSADYSDRVTPLSISLDGRRHDGGLGERDNVMPDIETIMGGAGNDLIVGSISGNLLLGNAGDDTLYGMAGNDTLMGGLGVDILNGGRGDDEFHSGIDNGAHDFLYGGKGIDRAQTDRRDSRDSIETLFK